MSAKKDLERPPLSLNGGAVIPAYSSVSFRLDDADLLNAINRSDSATVRKWISEGGDVNKKFKGDTLLMLAVKREKSHLVALLLYYKADTSLIDAEGQTPEGHAKKQLKSERQLFQLSGSSRYGRVMQPYILQQITLWRGMVKQFEAQHPKEERDKKQDIPMAQDKTAGAGLYLGRVGMKRALRAQVEQAASAATKPKEKQEQSSSKERWNMKALLQRFGKGKAKPSGDVEMHAPLAEDEKAVLGIRSSEAKDFFNKLKEVVSEKKHDINKSYDSLQGQTLLSYVTNRGDLKAVQYLLAQGADPFAKDAKGQTALMYANAKLEDERGVQMLHDVLGYKPSSKVPEIVNVLEAAEELERLKEQVGKLEWAVKYEEGVAPGFVKAGLLGLQKLIKKVPSQEGNANIAAALSGLCAAAEIDLSDKAPDAKISKRSAASSGSASTSRSTLMPSPLPPLEALPSDVAAATRSKEGEGLGEPIRSHK